MCEGGRSVGTVPVDHEQMTPTHQEVTTLPTAASMVARIAVQFPTSSPASYAGVHEALDADGGTAHLEKPTPPPTHAANSCHILALYHCGVTQVS